MAGTVEGQHIMVDGVARGRVVCFGEMLLRLSAVQHGGLLQHPALDAHFGGAEANVAIALARMGTPSSMLSVLPEGPLGDAAIEQLRRHAVDVSAIRRVPGRLGLYYFVPGTGHRASSVHYDRQASTFTTLAPGEIDWSAVLDGAAWLHMSGITPALGPESAAVAVEAAQAARAAGVRLSFDGNYRATLWDAWPSNPREVLSTLVGEADLLFGNHRDVALLLGRPFEGDTPDARRAAAEALFERFPRLEWIASTAREVIDAETNNLAGRLDGRERGWETEPVAIGRIIDRIGTGDAFAAGMLHGLMTAEPQDALQTAVALAVLKHYVPGDASIATRPDIDAFLSGQRDVRR
ncbi:MAG TPA: sugar kinase [Sphingomonas sp.]